MQLTAHPIGCICNGCMSMRHTAIEIGLAKPGEFIPDSIDVSGYDVFIGYSTDYLQVAVMNCDTFHFEFETHSVDSFIDASNPGDN